MSLFSSNTAQDPANSQQEKAPLPAEYPTQVSAEDYEFITDLEGSSTLKTFQLGLMLTPTSIEVHLLSAEKQNPEVLAEFKLSGHKFNDRILDCQNVKIKVSKPDRGTLKFELQDPEIQNPKAVIFKSLIKPGGISLSVRTVNLEPNGKHKIGATNQVSSELKIARPPSYQEDLEILNTALSSRQYRIHGLMDPDSIRDFCTGMRDIFARWQDLKPRERILEIRLLSNRTLMQAGVYPCYFPEKYISNWESFSPKSPCRFTSSDWSLHRSPHFVRQAELTKKGKLTFMSSLYKELRYAEQTWLTLRYLAGNYPLLLKRAGFKEQLSSVAQLARKFPISSAGGIKDLCEKLFDSITTTKKNGSPPLYLGNLAQHDVSLNLYQRIAAKAGWPYLFHDLDAIKAANLVKKFGSCYLK